MSEPFIVGKSPLARGLRERRRQLHALTGGRCYYCGFPVTLDRERPTRDWIVPFHHRRMIIEHKLPTVRGGSNNPENHVPSCHPCNSSKASLTVDEFRFIRGLRGGTLSFSFFGERPSVKRDWLCVHSRSFERGLLLQNHPGAAKAYGRGKVARA